MLWRRPGYVSPAAERLIGSVVSLTEGSSHLTHVTPVASVGEIRRELVVGDLKQVERED